MQILLKLKISLEKFHFFLIGFQFHILLDQALDLVVQLATIHFLVKFSHLAKLLVANDLHNRCLLRRVGR